VKRGHHDRLARAAFDSPCSPAKLEPERDVILRYAENSSAAVAGNAGSIVHTARAFNPPAHQAARKKTA